jgi:hypothetical protein
MAFSFVVVVSDATGRTVDATAAENPRPRKLVRIGGFHGCVRKNCKRDAGNEPEASATVACPSPTFPAR